MKNEKIIYCYPLTSTFIRKDLIFLEKHFLLKQYSFIPSSKISILIHFFSQFFFLLKNGWNSKIIICRFVGWHSLLPGLFGYLLKKPVLYILGGGDCHSFPEFNYGGFKNKFYTKILKISYHFATHLAPVHESLINCNYKYDKSGEPKQGCLYFFPEIKATYAAIYNGYDCEKFYNKNVTRIPNSFITVAANINGPEFYLKGIDLIIELAKRHSESNFTIIGNITDKNLNISSNVQLISSVPNDQIADVLNKYEFYFQISLAEGFPNALCEAMLCGCIPIGSDVFSIPFIIDQSGFILKHRNIDELEEIIVSALKSDKSILSLKASERIKNNFSIARRETELVEIINRLIDGKPPK